MDRKYEMRPQVVFIWSSATPLYPLVLVEDYQTEVEAEQGVLEARLGRVQGRHLSSSIKEMTPLGPHYLHTDSPPPDNQTVN